MKHSVPKGDVVSYKHIDITSFQPPRLIRDAFGDECPRSILNRGKEQKGMSSSFVLTWTGFERQLPQYIW